MCLVKPSIITRTQDRVCRYHEGRETLVLIFIFDIAVVFIIFKKL